MNLMSLENISKTLKDAPLFEGVSLGIEHDERIGLLGDNGSGKSTFLSLLTGTLLPDTGTIARNRELEISILEQRPQFTADSSITMALFDDTAPTIAILNGYRKALESYEHHHGSEKVLAQYISRMDEIHGWEIENTYQSLLTELGIPSSEHHMKVHTLSGGMQKKVALARSLSSNPNLLILDEPTNHLDIETIEWLEHYLASARTAAIIVTHDRYFLDTVCNRIFEIDRKNIFTYQGNYAAFLEQKEQRTAVETAGQSKINAILRRELEWLKRGPQARTGKDRGRKQRIEDLMDSRMTDEKEQAEFSSSHRKLGKKVLELKEITKSYDGRMILSPFSYSFKQGERIGLLGPNGSGKTTFLELITGRILLDGGVIDCGIHTEFGYYDQLSRPLPPDKTPLEFISEISESIPMADGNRVSASKFLELFGFDVSFHRIAISRLSGGETRRLYLISILISSPNFLVLDEPTNDLDIATLRRLENYLEQYTGCALIISHDRAFLDRTTDYLFLFDGLGAIQGYAGRYRDLKAERGAPFTPKPPVKPATGETRSNQKRARKLSFKEKNEFDSLLDEIEGLETEKSELEESFLHPNQNPEELEQKNRRYHTAIDLIDEKTLRWEFLASIDEGN